MSVLNKTYLWPVVFLLAFVAVLCKFYPVYQAVALIPALTGGIILIDNPRRYLCWYLFLLALFPLLGRIIPGLASHLDELIGGAILFLFAMGLVFRRFGKRTSYQAMFNCLLAWSLISLAFNQTSVVGFLRFFLAYGLFFPVYLLAKSYMKIEDLTAFLKGAIAIFWINFILNLGWYLGINPIFNPMINIGSYVDMAQGTFEGCDLVAYFCCMLAYFIICAIHFRVGSERLQKVLKVTLVAVFIQLYFTYTNHAMVLFIIAGTPLLLLTGLWKRWQSAMALLVGVIVVVMLMQGESEVAQQLNINNLRERKERLHNSAKVILYQKIAVDSARDHPYEWLLGAGPAYGIGPIGKDNMSPMALRYLLDFFTAGRDQKVNMQFTSITGNANSAILTIWSDIGVVGNMVYFLPFFMMLLQSLIIAKKAKSQERKAFSIALFSSTLFLLVMCILIDILHVKFFSYALWAIFGILSGNSESEIKESARIPSVKKNRQIRA